MKRRENIANAAARELVGIWYCVLALHLDRKELKRALDWHGVIETLSLEFRRYADSEARRLLAGEGAAGRAVRPPR